MFDDDISIRRRIELPVERLLRGAGDAFLYRPWLDGAALRLITRWFFPLSRAWATALAVDGDAEAFLQAMPLRKFAELLLPRALQRVGERREALVQADARWEEGFFGSGPADRALEEDRISAAHALMNLRSAFIPIHCIDAFPAVAWEVEPPAAVARRHAHRLDSACAFLPTTALDQVEASRGFLGPGGIEGWVRFPSPVADVGGPPGSLATARITQPLGAGAWGRAEAMPSLIFCHGIGMEPEYWRDGRVKLASFVDAGVRVIRPEAPWHGRRRLEGTYGGEPVMARGPGGMIDFLHAAVLELGTLIAWARATRGGPVVLAGVSLGALTAQLVASVAADWPQEMRPDALFLIAPSLSMAKVTFEGSLTRAVGVPEAIVRGGWQPDEILRWQPLMEPVAAPAIDPDRIVVVLGETDDVTLAEGGENLVAVWGVPEANVFRFPAGHFTTSVALLRGGVAVNRLMEILRRLKR